MLLRACYDSKRQDFLHTSHSTVVQGPFSLPIPFAKSVK